MLSNLRVLIVHNKSFDNYRLRQLICLFNNISKEIALYSDCKTSCIFYKNFRVIDSVSLSEHLLTQENDYDIVLFLSYSELLNYATLVKTISKKSKIFLDTEGRFSEHFIPFDPITRDARYIQSDSQFELINKYVDVLFARSNSELKLVKENIARNITVISVPDIYEDRVSSNCLLNIEKINDYCLQKKIILLFGDYSDSVEEEGLLFFVSKIYPFIENFIIDNQLEIVVTGKDIPIYLLNSKIKYRRGGLSDSLIKRSFCLVECRRRYTKPYSILSRFMKIKIPIVISPFTLLGYDNHSSARMKISYGDKSFSENIRYFYENQNIKEDSSLNAEFSNNEIISNFTSLFN